MTALFKATPVLKQLVSIVDQVTYVYGIMRAPSEPFRSITSAGFSVGEHGKTSRSHPKHIVGMPTRKLGGKQVEATCQAYCCKAPTCGSTLLSRHKSGAESKGASRVA